MKGWITKRNSEGGRQECGMRRKEEGEEEEGGKGGQKKKKGRTKIAVKRRGRQVRGRRVGCKRS